MTRTPTRRSEALRLAALAREQGSFREAATRWIALAASDDPPPYAHLRAGACAVLSDHPGVMADAAEVVRAAEDGLERELLLFQLEFLRTPLERSMVRWRQAVERFGEPGEPRLRLHWAVCRAEAAWMVGDVATVLAVREQCGVDDESALAMAGRLRLFEAYAHWLLGNRESARTRIEPLRRTPPGRPERASAFNLLGQMSALAGDWRGAGRHFAEAAQAARAADAPIPGILAATWSGFVAMLGGRYSQARAHAEHALSHSADLGHRTFDPIAHATLAVVAAAAGRWDDTGHHLGEAQRFVGERVMPETVFCVAVAAAVCSRWRGDAPGILDALQPLDTPVIGDLTEAVGATWWLSLRAEASLATGDTAAVRRFLARTPDWTPLFLYPDTLTARLASGASSDTALAQARRALTASSENDFPLATLDLLDLLVELGARDAVTLGRRAANLRLRLGVVDERASARGLTVPPEARLTRRETECVTLAADGLMNSEIAQTLHLSVKTVEHHMSTALAKLGMRNRRDLRQLRG
ncbi:helix-turn-helix transcriptional regulator [Aeromicrobium piscarium]|uniref:Helix-turn-helix transcriptional regulator n=1 Tax=Aeromicrobium piscarium TaxID=2590901 RepID=A0A554RWH2_9ACTN|nr:helix-turn-helix transcriptional regulator [Aeromicrobium piscarium]TSD58441.1 helix-turn-helix transcriptional regulator [Aeromicrobium piscarium]